MTRRVGAHPILVVGESDDVAFSWRGEPMTAGTGEAVSSALLAHGVETFGRHPIDGTAQGIFCANGQCAQCMVLADGRPVKACMTSVRPGMQVEPLEGLPVLPERDCVPPLGDAPRLEVPVLVIGGGPAGLSAAALLGARGIETLLIDDKDRLGGKLVLQTHRFFGSIDAVFAGTRGIDIATRLADEARAHASVTVWPSSTALAVFSDGWVGILKGGDTYALVKPEVVLVATGAREKALAFPGNTLPGVYGAGAFQTLLNRDLVRTSDRLFVVGGGNVGLITAYHALQAGITVVGLAEALPECGGYRVHRRKLERLGVPIHTSHTIVRADGEARVTAVTIARVDARGAPVPGSERSYACDTVLIAVGLDPVDDFTHKARDAGMRVFAAGDADRIAEASAAIFAGRIGGVEIARALGVDDGVVPPEWLRTAELLRSKPGAVHEGVVARSRAGVHPVFHCDQEIPCNPCTSVCPQELIHIDPDDLRGVPAYLGEGEGGACIGCERCVRICPGLAITLVDAREDAAQPTVTIATEFGAFVQAGDTVRAVDADGMVLGDLEVVRVRAGRALGGTVLVKVRAPAEIAGRVAGIRLQGSEVGEPLERPVAAADGMDDAAMVCRCERVSARTVQALVRAGHRDVNEIKAVSRVGMGACGGKTCTALVERVFREEGVAPDEVTPAVRRPLFVEVPLGVFAGAPES
jgi:sarcosine oxidase, subunit alpha